MERGATSSSSLTTVAEMLERVQISDTRIKVVRVIEVIWERKKVQGDNSNNPGRGPNPNLWYGNVGGGYKRGAKERDANGDQRERDFRSKLRGDQDSRQMGAGGPSHCFNCNRDGHF
jgi:hypothetical protein